MTRTLALALILAPLAACTDTADTAVETPEGTAQPPPP